MSTKHTPGPWRIESRFGFSDAPRDVIMADGVKRVAVVSQHGVANKEVAEANARLIAEAPRLLQTVENALLTLAIMKVPMETGNVATNEDLLKIMEDSFQEAIDKAML